MATVYVATDLRLERRVALKVMHGHLSDDTVFQSRFIQEARAAARLADPHVVNVFDQGSDGEIAYLVMEYLPGITLRELLREEKRLTVPQTICLEPFEDLQQLGRFTLRDEGKSIAIGKVVALE